MALMADSGGIKSDPTLPAEPLISPYSVSHFFSIVQWFSRQHHQPAIVARKHNPIIREFSARLSARKLPEMAIVSAAIRKLLHLIDWVQ